MSKIKVKACGFSMEASGSDDFVFRESSAFYEYVSGNVGKVVTGLFGGYEEPFEPLKPFPQDAQPVVGKGCVYRTQEEITGNWEEISRAIKDGTIEPKMGDCVSFNLNDGQEVDAVVTLVTDEYIRFESRDCVGNRVCWNENDDTTGGIAASDVMDYLNNEIWELLPQELKKVITQVTRKHSDKDGNVHEYIMGLFLPSASEVFDEDNCYGDEGIYEQMEYYKDRRKRMRGECKGGDTCSYWLASARSGASANACFVNSIGGANYANASYEYRVPLCFHISKSK